MTDYMAVASLASLASIDRYAAIAALALLATYALRAVAGLLLAGALALFALSGRRQRPSHRHLAKVAQRISPAFLRGTVAALTAASVTMTAGASAHAFSAPPESRADRPAASDTRAPLAGPNAPPIVAAPERDGTRPEPPRSGPRVTPSTHVVAAGESLWTITADALGDRASLGDVARTWPALYRANREAIGRDPNVVDIGLPLLLPDSLRAGQQVPSKTPAPTATPQGCEAK